MEIFKLRRNQFDIANVLQYRPPNNNLDAWLKEKNPKIEEGIAELKKQVLSKDYKGILAFGWFALLALTGEDGITERRGSIYPCKWNPKLPVLGTYHPAHLFHEPKLTNTLCRDVAKFYQVVTEGWMKPIERNLVLFPRLDEWEQWSKKNGPYVACDIEADVKTKRLTEVGFAFSARDAVVLDATKDEVVEAVRVFLATFRGRIVFHNAAFDVPFLKHYYGIDVAGEIHDTMLMHHTLYPEMPKDLGFCVSLYTNEPYFKHLGRARGNRQGSRQEWARYNALDTATTAEIFPILEAKLKKLGLLDVYERDRRMLPVAIRMALRGVRYDTKEATILQEKLELQWKRWQSVLDKRAGVEGGAKRKLKSVEFTEGVNVLSHPVTTKLLYEQLGLPKQMLKDKKTNTWKVTTNQLKLLNLYPQIRNRNSKKIVRALLMVREARKLLSSYMKVKIGEDGRIRTSFNVAGTETGRWSAGTFLIDAEGTNLQTVPPRWKRCFISDERKVLFYADYSQIEARYVAYDAQDLAQIAVFERGGDIHRENAARMLKKRPEDVTKDERQYLGKTVHALNYDIGPDTLVESINKHGLETGMFLTKEFTSHVRDMYRTTYKDVLRWQDWVWQEVRKTRVLTNYFGRRRLFTGPTKGQFAHTTRGEAIAFRPQSSVPDALNMAMERIEADSLLKEHNVEVMLQVHDAVFGQGDEATVNLWAPRLLELMVIPLKIHGRDCIVPTDLAVGTRWSELKKLGGKSG